ncbi:hypothetical protein SPRG_13397 [Saprolegnia parasitica CBS 223.65]|uniref:SLC12A transporter C-terminal domain-containing protein n=1 Tax=Saprolegnia parasitica (strain CBS 223.65) TaxID=695850 RepID=A0A067BQ87_SAPPC|nr:hypothetical protein SPRG_13397 [Saprolegnia parasitica CBS 223.65]KDO20644.1 hypothetical protein SPRG_13397 [Saprolegnia parasitica CBS 223.65]|eukprot:XP_012208610.1 hypothetical protein SPRG_13397 [Saprolegnia parasitica CBS 223.65]
MVTVLVLNLACVISVGSTMPNHVLKTDKFILSTVAWPTKQLINLGIFFSAIGGALQNLTGHPRMLAAMANDNVIPFLRPFAAKDSDEPRKAVGLILAMSCLPCIAGNLDFLAPFLTMSSLMLCATLNFACFSMALGHAPGFRPKWHYFHWSTALLGSMGSIGLMLFFSWTKAILAILLCVLIRLYVRCLGFKKDWGSSIRGMHLELACWLLHLPSSPRLLDFASQLKEGHGLVEVVNLLAGKDDTTYDVASEATHRLRAHLLGAHIAGFGHVYACKNILKSMGTVAEASGMGPLRSNTVLLGWPKAAATRDPAFLDDYVDMLHEIINCKKALLLAKGLASFPSNDDSRRGTVDIWWVLHDGGLLLLIPYLLRLHFVWRKSKLRLFTVVSMKEDAGEIAARLADFLEGVRIEAEVHVVPLRNATISSLLIKRTKDELLKKKEALAAMKVTTMSFAIRDGYEQLVDDLSNVGTAIDDDERSRGKRFAASPPPTSSDTRLVHAQLMNQHMLEHSGDASLVVVNLPRLIGVPALCFVTYVEALTQHLPAVLLVRGSGREVVTLNA